MFIKVAYQGETHIINAQHIAHAIAWTTTDGRECLRIKFVGTSYSPIGGDTRELFLTDDAARAVLAAL